MSTPIIDLEDYDPEAQLVSEADLAGMGAVQLQSLKDQLVTVSGCDAADTTNLLLASGLDLNRAVNLHFSGVGASAVAADDSNNAKGDVLDLTWRTNSDESAAGDTCSNSRVRRRAQQQLDQDEALARKMQEELRAQEKDAALANATEALRAEAALAAAKDVVWRQRRDINDFLTRTQGLTLKIDSVKENEFSKPNTMQYERFRRAYDKASDKTIRLVFHGTPEANVPRIMQHGLDPAKRSGQAAGRCVVVYVTLPAHVTLVFFCAASACMQRRIFRDGRGNQPRVLPRREADDCLRGPT